MVDLHALCQNPDCGHRFTLPNIVNIGGGSATVIVRNSTVTCPECRKTAQLVDGQYDVAAGVVTAFKAFALADILAFSDILNDFVAGVIDEAEVAKKSKTISPKLLEFWDWFKSPSGMAAVAAAGLLLAIISLYVSIASSAASDRNAAEAHSDAERGHFDAERAHSDAERDHQLQLAIYERLQEQIAPSGEREQKSPPKAGTQRQTQPKQLKPNRRDRRRAAALAKRPPR